MINPFIKRLDAFTTNLVIYAALVILGDWAPYSKIARLAGGLASTTLNPTKVKNYLETLCESEMGIVVHKKEKRGNQLDLQLYKAKDLVTLRNDVELLLSSTFIKSTCLDVKHIQEQLDEGITVFG